MTGVARLGDTDSDGNTISSTGNNSSVFANGILIARQSDQLANTDGDITDPSPIVITGGSSTVFVCGLPVARLGDPDSDGAVIAVGSPTVSAG